MVASLLRQQVAMTVLEDRELIQILKLVRIVLFLKVEKWTFLDVPNELRFQLIKSPWPRQIEEYF